MATKATLGTLVLLCALVWGWLIWGVLLVLVHLVRVLAAVLSLAAL